MLNLLIIMKMNETIKILTKRDLYGMTIEERKRIVESLIMPIDRVGVESVLRILSNETDYYTAPSSTKYHSNFDGGLVVHSLLVLKSAYSMIEMLRSTVDAQSDDGINLITDDSIILTSLLHDVCKCGFYQKMPKRRQNPTTGLWETYNGYEVNDRFPIGHGEKSAMMLLKWGLDLTPEEMLAIRWHMGGYDSSVIGNGDGKIAYNKAINSCRLTGILQCADNLTTICMEDIIVPPAI